MSWTLNVFFNDSGIRYTTVTIYYAYPGRTDITQHSYGSSAFVVRDIPDGTNVSFRVISETGYEFYRWVYREGSATSTVHYSYTSTYTYLGSKDLFIRAESQIYVPPAPTYESGCYVNVGGVWRKAKPYVFYASENRWRQAAPYVYKESTRSWVPSKIKL